MHTAVILAAGAGTRLGALGRRYSKPMVPVAGRPLIDWVIGRLGETTVARVIVVGHPSDAQLAAFLRASHPQVTLVLQPERRGIADALTHALPLLADEPAYLACACDSLFPPDDIARAIACGELHPGDAVLGILDMGLEATATRSAVRLNGDRAIEIIEKPVAGTAPSSLVALPLYWLPQSFARYVDTALAVSAERYISTALNAFAAGGGIVRAVTVSERIEITVADDVERAAQRLAAL